jgi:hypothetical protein
LSEHTDNPELEDDDMEEAELPPRPRGRLLRPLPLLLIAVTIAAAGFLGGVLAQKGSEGNHGGASGLAAGGLPSFAAAKSGEAESGTSAGGALPGAASSAASGTVTSVEGHTIYVKEADGTVVAVKAGDGAAVTRDANVAAKKVHPGDAVTVEGSKHGSTVKASSIAASEAGVESALAFAAPGAAGGETSVESLFEE